MSRQLRKLSGFSDFFSGIKRFLLCISSKPLTMGAAKSLYQLRHVQSSLRDLRRHALADFEVAKESGRKRLPRKSVISDASLQISGSVQEARALVASQRRCSSSPSVPFSVED